LAQAVPENGGHQRKAGWPRLVGRAAVHVPGALGLRRVARDGGRLLAGAAGCRGPTAAHALPHPPVAAEQAEAERSVHRADRAPGCSDGADAARARGRRRRAGQAHRRAGVCRLRALRRALPADGRRYPPPHLAVDQKQQRPGGARHGHACVRHCADARVCLGVFVVRPLPHDHHADADGRLPVSGPASVWLAAGCRGRPGACWPGARDAATVAALGPRGPEFPVRRAVCVGVRPRGPGRLAGPVSAFASPAAGPALPAYRRRREVPVEERRAYQMVVADCRRPGRRRAVGLCRQQALCPARVAAAGAKVRRLLLLAGGLYRAVCAAAARAGQDQRAAAQVQAPAGAGRGVPAAGLAARAPGSAAEAGARSPRSREDAVAQAAGHRLGCADVRGQLQPGRALRSGPQPQREHQASETGQPREARSRSRAAQRRAVYCGREAEGAERKGQVVQGQDEEGLE
ncbi:hypothetical protein LPJ56_005936, partial [Coemansia sp. RSA 2599]